MATVTLLPSNFVSILILLELGDEAVPTHKIKKIRDISFLFLPLFSFSRSKNEGAKQVPTTTFRIDRALIVRGL